jgi:high-affinity iron transporter
MISREGMETALMLIQVHDAKVVSGSLLGALAATALAFAWMKLGHLINLKRFFQVTSIFLILFIFQILIYSFHEFIESGIIPNSDALNTATEPFSPEGIYGKWLSLGMVVVCGVWLIVSWFQDMLRRRKT